MLHVVEPTGAPDPAGAGGRVVVVVVVAGFGGTVVVGGGATGAASGAAIVVVVVVVVVVGTTEVAELWTGAACCWRTIIESQLRNDHQSHDGPRAFAGTTVLDTMKTTTNHATMGRPLPPGRCMRSRVGRNLGIPR